MPTRFTVLLAIWLQLNGAFTANILYISPVPSISHQIWNEALAMELADKGHNVTMLSHNKEQSIKNFHTILIEGIYDSGHLNFSLDDLIHLSVIEDFKLMYRYAYTICKYDFNSKGFRTLLSYPEDYKFDLIVFDITSLVCLYPFIDKFNCPPVVAVTTLLLPPVLSHVFGNPIQTAYMPFYRTPYSDRMTFIQRFYNSFYIYAVVFYRQYYILPHQEALARKYFPNKFRSFHQIERNISILLANTDPNFESPLDIPPNIIPVGGLHIKPIKPLPQSLQKIINSSKHGVILFSLGSIIHSDQLSDVATNAFLKAFSRLRQTILWKFETNEVLNLPKNVFIRKWLPQSDILAHPRTKVFITHAGGLSLYEAVNHGVPILAIPFVLDQFSNAARFVNKKMGLSMSYNNITEGNVYSKLLELLNNPIYTNNIKVLSKKYKDQPNSPMERAVFWIEYVLRHGGAEHLSLAARDMNILQTYNLDILACILLTVCTMCILFLSLLRSIKCSLKSMTKKIKLS